MCAHPGKRNRFASSLCAAVVVLALLSAAGRADASCGYYVIGLHPSSEWIASAMPIEHVPAAPAIPAGCPCRGPQCGAGQNGAPFAVAPLGAGYDALGISSTASELLTEPMAVLVAIRLQFTSEAREIPIVPPPRA
jgi:hypothetical protein